MTTRTTAARPRARHLHHILTCLPQEEVEVATNQTLADLIGTSPRHVSRMLAQLVEDGLVALSYGPPNLAGFGSQPSGRRIHLLDEGVAR